MAAFDEFAKSSVSQRSCWDCEEDVNVEGDEPKNEVPQRRVWDGNSGKTAKLLELDQKREMVARG